MHYTSLLEPVYPEASRKITVILQQLKQSDYITHKQLDYLTPPSEPRHRQLYLLPKIHKSADKWPQKDLMPPGRPIISDCNSMVSGDYWLMSVDYLMMSDDNWIMSDDNWMMSDDNWMMSDDYWMVSDDYWTMSDDNWMMSYDN